MLKACLEACPRHSCPPAGDSPAFQQCQVPVEIRLCELCLLEADNVCAKIVQQGFYGAILALQHGPEAIDVPSQQSHLFCQFT